MVVELFSVGAGVEVVMRVVVGALSSAWEDGVVHKADITISVEDGVAVVGDSDGKTTINLNATETLRSTLSLNGGCWRRLISIGWQN